MSYVCSLCGLGVIVIKETSQIIKACKCDAPITANIESNLKGKGTVK